VDFSTLKMEAIHFSETSVNARSTQCHNPEDDILHQFFSCKLQKFSDNCFALCFNIQTTQSVRIAVVGSTSINQLMNIKYLLPLLAEGENNMAQKFNSFKYSCLLKCLNGKISYQKA
jgi:hypothetical protein